MVFFDFIYWKFQDFKNRDIIKNRLYGMEGYFGLPGYGKTMGLVYRLEELRKKYSDTIYIATNFFWKGEDFHISSWEDLIKDYNKNIVFAYDEIQNEFDSRSYKSFPTQLLSSLTQIRKGNSKMILYTAQRFNRVDKVIRELTNYCWDCKTFWGRLTILRRYYIDVYEDLNSQVQVSKKMKIHCDKKIKFVQTDFLRNQYDSFQVLQSVKSKDFMTREEMINFELLK